MGRAKGKVAAATQPTPSLTIGFQRVLPGTRRSSRPATTAPDSFIDDLATSSTEGAFELMGSLLMNNWDRKSTDLNLRALLAYGTKHAADCRPGSAALKELLPVEADLTAQWRAELMWAPMVHGVRVVGVADDTARYSRLMLVAFTQDATLLRGVRQFAPGGSLAELVTVRDVSKTLAWLHDQWAGQS